MERNRSLYDTYVEELMDAPARQRAESEVDDPLSGSENSAWNAYFKDQHTLEEINKDVQRTYPDMSFFQEDPRHYKALHRSLFLYAKLNPGICYVQGMNEIYAPIYYVLSHDVDPQCVANAEKDAFFMLVNLMSDIRDNFCETLDHSATGIKGSLAKMMHILARVDLELYNDLRAKDINPQFYGNIGTGLYPFSISLHFAFILPPLTSICLYFTSISPLFQVCGGFPFFSHRSLTYPTSFDSGTASSRRRIPPSSSSSSAAQC